MRISEFLQADRAWRHFANEVGPTSADDEDPTDPYTDPGGGAGIGLPPGYPIFPTSPKQNYPTGPPAQSSYYNSPPKPSPPPPPDPWSGISSAVHSSASQDVDKFESLIGGAAQGFDSEGTALKLAQSGMNVTGGSLDAFQWLYDNTLTAQQQGGNPWAQFGMDADTYNTTVAKMDSAYFSWTGDQLSAQGVGKYSGMWQALRENWTPDEIQNFATYGSPTGALPMLASAQYSGSMPWLSAGQTYSATLQQYESIAGTAPTDKASLASFWRFGQSSKMIGSSAVAVGTSAKQLQGFSQSEVR